MLIAEPFTRKESHQMEFIETPIEGLLIVKPKIFDDARGYFFESFNKESFQNHGLNVDFVQDNQSMSGKGVLRGLHFQNEPYAQGKLVSALKGSVLDVVVDIRRKSSTFGKKFSVILDSKSKMMLWIPPGFAHGFATLEEETVFFYKCTAIYNKQSEGGILWKDSDLGIDWGIQNPLISEKDKLLPSWKQFCDQVI